MLSLNLNIVKIIFSCLIALNFLIFISCKSTSSIQELKKESIPEEKEIANEQAYLGILYVETNSGIQIAEVFPDSPAQKANLEPGDIILTANGYPVVGPYTLKEHIFSLKPGTEVLLEVIKINGKKVLLKATLESMPEKYKKFYKIQ